MGVVLVQVCFENLFASFGISAIDTREDDTFVLNNEGDGGVSNDAEVVDHTDVEGVDGQFAADEARVLPRAAWWWTRRVK